MYDKVISDPHALQEEYEEVVIGIEGTCFEEVLFYRDEGNVSKFLQLC
jgi:hypothetical protein